MKKEISSAVIASIETSLQVTGTKLQNTKPTLEQHLKKPNPPHQTEEQSYEEYLDNAADAYLEYERYCYEQMTLSPEQEECLAKQLTGELPIKNGNKLGVVSNLYLSGFHVSEHFKTLYPEAWRILDYYWNIL